MSRSVLRAAANQHSQQTNPPPLPQDIEQWLGTYRPQKLTDSQWETIRSTHVDVFRVAGHRTLPYVKRRSSELAGYLHWRAITGQDFDRISAMTYSGVDRYYAEGLEGTPKSKDTIRYRLRALSRNSGVHQYAPTSPTFGYTPPKAPYTITEEAFIRKATLTIASSTLKRAVCAVVGLGGGAGLRAEDFRYLQAGHISKTPTGVLRVDVPKPLARVTFVRADYAPLVRAGLEGLAKGQLLVGRDGLVKNPISHKIADADMHDCPHIETVRLRSTWLVRMLERNVPLKAILDASGLRSARTLAALCEHAALPENFDLPKVFL